MTDASITELLCGDHGDAQGEVLARLLPLVYDELRRIARWHLARERTSHTLCATALVHEAYLKLVDDPAARSRGRAYFFAAAARAMRQILVEHARARAAQKRGAGVALSALDGKEIPTDDFLDAVLALEGALTRLEAMSPRQARVVECRVFGGLDVAGTAEVLETSPRTVKRDWAVARAWLFRELGAGVPPDPPAAAP